MFTSDFSFQKIISFVITLSVIAVFTDIYLKYDINKESMLKKTNLGFNKNTAMLAFYIFFALILTFHIGSLSTFYKPVVIVGTLMIFFGCMFNIISRHKLIINLDRIQKNSMLSTVNHPSYCSYVIALYGASISYHNYFSFLLVTFIFIPLVYVLTKQEEKLLIEEFGDDYLQYVQNICIFFLKLPRKLNKKTDIKDNLPVNK